METEGREATPWRPAADTEHNRGLLRPPILGAYREIIMRAGCSKIEYDTPQGHMVRKHTQQIGKTRTKCKHFILLLLSPAICPWKRTVRYQTNQSEVCEDSCPPPVSSDKLFLEALPEAKWTQSVQSVTQGISVITNLATCIGCKFGHQNNL